MKRGEEVAGREERMGEGGGRWKRKRKVEEKKGSVILFVHSVIHLFTHSFIQSLIS